MRFGYWMPIFGGWLRNVPDEGMPVSWEYVRDLTVASERHGFDLTLIAELNLNDIKGHRAPSLDCWTLAPALAAVTGRLELMLAVRPNYHSPSLTAKALSTLDIIAPGRVSLNVVSSWWRDESAQYGAPFDEHDARYARTQEWLEVVSRLLREDTVTHHGPLYDLAGTVLEPKPSRVPPVYMGGESPKAKEVISNLADAYVMHGDPPDVIAGKVAEMSARRAQAGRPPLTFGVAGYVICRDTESEAKAELAASSTSGPHPRPTRPTRISSPVPSSNRGFRWRNTASPTGGCAPGWSARRNRSSSGCGPTNGPEPVSCCCSSPRSTRKWPGSAGM